MNPRVGGFGRPVKRLEHKALATEWLHRQGLRWCKKLGHLFCYRFLSETALGTSNGEMALVQRAIGRAIGRASRCRYPDDSLR